MKSKTYKEFFENFKEQSTCLICGRPLYIKNLSKHGNQHIEKTCFKHTFYLLTYSIIIGKDVIVFNNDGMLTWINRQEFSSIDILQIVKLYDEKSFMYFIQNLKVLL